MSVRAELYWDAAGLIPTVVQETATGEVLMVAWMDRTALEATLRTGAGHYWSRSRQALWRKGETSGHVQHVDGLYADCDRDTLLLQVHQEGVACHTGARTCFYTRVSGAGDERPRAAAAAPPGGHQEGVAGHAGARTCFYTRVSGAGDERPRAAAAGPEFLEVLERTIESRKVDRPAGSYVARLFEKGDAFICRKIGEEATEVLTAARGGGGDDRGVAEAA